MSPSASTPQARHEANFESVRRQVFMEMQSHARTWLFRFVVPMNLGLLVLFLLFGGSKIRALVLLVALPFGQLGMLLGGRARDVRMAPFAWGSGHQLLMMALSGGIASPLLPMGIPALVAAGLVVVERRPKVLLAAWVACGLGLEAVLSLVPLGALPPPLVDVRGVPTAAYFVALSFASAFAVVSVVRTGIYVTDAYARVAVELATRREELYEDGIDHPRTLEAMAARIAHEVKNPLAAIKALSTHVARHTDDRKTAERLGIVASEADRLQSIVEGFLSFSRGFGALRLEPVRPYELARELAVLLETRLAEQQLSVEVIGDERVEILADGRKVRQALLNLVLNAMHASSAGVRITVAVALTKDDVVSVRVIDRGAGMSPAVQERIRRPYYSTREGGSGLGIALARSAVEQHGGSLQYDSAEGVGTTATLALPLVALPPAVTILPRA